MALSATILGGLIETNLTNVGANGYNRTIFCNALAAGIVMSIVGKPFTTSDVGSTFGNGSGSGTGITNLDATNMKTIAIATMSSTGINADIFMQAIMDAVVTHLSSATTLTSTHFPVFLGTGTVDVGSIGVVISEMHTNIKTQLQLVGANGINLDNLSLAIATGIVTDILASGTGTVSITGAYGGLFPPGPVPGTGSGSGTLS